MICSNCHNEISDNLAACPTCGQHFSVSRNVTDELMECATPVIVSSSMEVVGELLSATAEAALDVIGGLISNDL
ncbi:MAG: hypothetical protein ACI38Q_05405 [Candidatus Bruticola sp.]